LTHRNMITKIKQMIKKKNDKTTLRPFAVVAKYIGSFYFLDQYFAETMTETKRLQFGFSPEFGLTNHRFSHHCSLHNVIVDVIADNSVFLCLFTN